MPHAPQPENENRRLQKLHEYHILDTSPEQAFDDVVSLAAQICGTPFALITMVDSDREWFKARKGITAKETARNGGFGAQTILSQDVLLVSNTSEDPRFSANALVTSEPHIRFYAGVPVQAPTGETLGTLCVLDTAPRELSAEQIESLRALAHQVVSVLELRRNKIPPTDTLAGVESNKLSQHATLDARLYIGSIVDVSNPKHLEHLFRQAVESAPNAIVMVNEAGKIELVNSQTEAFFGYKREELIGHPMEILVPKRFRGEHEGFRKVYYANPQSRPMGAGRELYGVRKDGSEFPVEIGLSVIEGENGILVLSSIVDITERKIISDNLKNALNEKEMLLKEVYHRVKNNLQVVSSLINLQARNVKNEMTADLLRQSADRIKSMALLHEKLYQSKHLARINLNEYIRSLVDHLLFGYGAQASKINVNLEVEDLFLDVDTAIPCGLIINELVSNALKHAFPDNRRGTIEISFRKEQAEYILVIADNGVGFPADLNFEKSASLGLQLVDTLTRQLMGQMNLEQTGGSRFMIRFPISFK
ncbi:MAG: histidine kinase dimerization/phosphoacceptor domain -containing protein [Methylococcales bacterium]|nr:histidine kinase dimerization/phosphoacceptor domain -containing protein [Methylococcales bacterium]